jgi:TonB-linked SusC/RagA family outer membrane protein
MKKLVFTLLWAFAFVQFALAQTVVSGTVTDAADGSPLPGVSVMVQGTTNGTMTDIDGKYNLSLVQAANALEFRFLGYETQTVQIANQTLIDVVLKSSTQDLDEVVVTALGIKREKKTLTYNVQDMDAEEIVRSKQDNVINALQGNISGVQITSTGGAPGASSEIILRGATSVDGNNQPLFVVDGVPISNESVSGTTNRAADLNPDDIASISVLKGAAASALYGIEAANGAIIITTKKGKEGKVSVSVNSSFTASRVGYLQDLQDVYTTGFGGNYSSQTFSAWGPVFRTSDVRYNNLEEFFDTGLASRFGANVTGGSEKLTFFLSASNVADKGMVPNADYGKTSIALKSGAKITDKLTANASVNIIKTDNTYGLVGTSGGWLSSAYRWPRWDNMKEYENPDGSERNIWIPTSGEMSSVPDNPWWTAYHNQRYDVVSRNIESLNFRYQLLEGLTFDYTVGRDFYSQHYKAVKEWGSTGAESYEGAISEFSLESERLSSTFIASYDKTFAQKYRITVLAGHNVQADKSLRTTTEGSQFKNPELLSVNNLKDVKVSQYTGVRRVVGVFGDLKFDYNNMLILGLTARNDWSSTLPLENRSFFYPSYSFGFIFSELTKDFFKPLSFGKARVSFAKVGKDAPPHKLTQTLEPFLGLGEGWKNGAFAGNPILKPEITQELEIGLDLRFFVGRLVLDATYYNRTSNDQIITPRVTPVTGAILQTVNSGSVENKGLEFLITGIPLKKKDLEWKIIANVFGNRSKLTKLFGDVVEFPVTYGQVTSVAIASSKLNQPLFSIVGTDYKRTPDGEMLIDENGYPVVGSDKDYIGNREPKVRFGLTNNVRYKNFALSVLIDGAYSADILNATAYGLLHNGSHTMLTEYRNKEFVFDGKVAQADGSYVQNTKPVILDYTYFVTNYGLVGTNFVENVSWVRLRNFTFEYFFPKSIASKIKASDLSVNIGANNLFLLSNYSGGDPEVNNAGPNGGASGAGTMGVDYYQVPVSRTLTLGFNIRF